MKNFKGNHGNADAANTNRHAADHRAFKMSHNLGRYRFEDFLTNSEKENIY